jgi:hypothetical protein
MRRHRALAVIATCLNLFAAQARGQQPVHRVGVLTAIEVPENTHALLDGLRERGYVVSGNLQIEYRYSQGRTEQMSSSRLARRSSLPPGRKTRLRSTSLLRRFRWSSSVCPTRWQLVSSRAWRIRVAM